MRKRLLASIVAVLIALFATTIAKSNRATVAGPNGATAAPSAPTATRSAPASDPDLERLNDTALRAYRAQNYDEALRLFEVAVAESRARNNQAYTAKFLSNIGTVHEKLERYADALAAHEAALAIDGRLHRRARQANDLGNISAVLLHLRRPQEALAATTAALALDRAIRNRNGEATDLGDAGRAYQALHRYVDALGAYKAALEIHCALNDRSGEGTTLTDIGTVYQELDRYEDALAAHEKALAIARHTRDESDEANSLGRIGLAYSHLARYAPALAAYTSSLAIHRKLHARSDEAADLANTGAAYEGLGRYDDALAAYEAALAISRELNDRSGEARYLDDAAHVSSILGRYTEAIGMLERAIAVDREAGDRHGLAVVLRHSGDLYANLGRRTDALAAHEEALALDRALQHALGEAEDLGSLGRVYVDLDRPADALDAFRKARAIDRAARDRFREANDIAEIGSVFGQLGRHKDALRAYAEALAIDRTLRNRLGAANVLVDVGITNLTLHRYGAALAAARESLAIHREIHNVPGESNALFNVAVAELFLGRNGAAEHDASASVAIKEKLGAANVWRPLGLLAQAETWLGTRYEAAALQHFDAALERIERLRAGLSDDRNRTAFFSTTLDTYDSYVAFLMLLNKRHPGKGYDRRAFEVFERKTARAALEQIAASAARHYSGIPQTVVDQEDAAAVALGNARDLSTKVLSMTPVDPLAVQAAQRNAGVLAEQQATLERRVATQYPQYFALRHPVPVPSHALQRDVLAAGEVLLAYDVSNDASVAWVVAQDRFEAVDLPDRKAIDASAAAIAKHIASIESRATTRSRDLPAFNRDSYALYRKLVPRAVADALAKAKSVVVVPSGSLYQIPFGALVTRTPADDGGQAHYLIQDLPISYAPSASLFGIVARSYAARRPASEPLLAFANPSFSNAPATQQSGTATGGTRSHLQFDAMTSAMTRGRGAELGHVVFPPLPGTATEAEAVRGALGATADSIIDGDAATRQRVLAMDAGEQLKKYQYVLFATHAVLPGQITGLTQPAIVLAHPEDGDGFLTMADVFGLSLNANFVALSACDTGVVADPRGDGISGLARAFLFAGTPAISVTLWQVDDGAAPLVTPRLFAAMRAGKPAAEALRDAQVAMLGAREARFRHPFAWAPYVIFGDGDLVNATR